MSTLQGTPAAGKGRRYPRSGTKDKTESAVEIDGSEDEEEEKEAEAKTLGKRKRGPKDDVDYDGDDDRDEEEEEWIISRILSPDLITKFKCAENCGRNACSVWITENTNEDEDEWYGCADCQSKFFGGFPTAASGELPMTSICQSHRALIAERCTDGDAAGAILSDLPTKHVLKELIMSSRRYPAVSSGAVLFCASAEEKAMTITGTLNWKRHITCVLKELICQYVKQAVSGGIFRRTLLPVGRPDMYHR